MPSTTTQKGQRSIERILQAAESVVAERGHDGATTRRIATVAGMDKRVISYYFGSRESLLVEVVNRTADRVGLAVAEDLREIRDPQRVLQVVWERLASERALARTCAVSGGEMAPAMQVASARFTALFYSALTDLGHDPAGAASLANATMIAIRGALLSTVEGCEPTVIDDVLGVLAAAWGLP